MDSALLTDRKELIMDVYLITKQNGKTTYVSASSAKSAMMKHFGVPVVAGATIKKVGSDV
jgi:hypothetical protein